MENVGYFPSLIFVPQERGLEKKIHPDNARKPASEDVGVISDYLILSGVHAYPSFFLSVGLLPS